MSRQLPDAIAGFIEIGNRGDGASVCGCFTADAQVDDEHQQHRGPTAIQAWSEQAQQRYQHHVQPLDFSVQGEVLALRAQVSGNFPGSPLQLDYRFTLRDGLIAALEIG